MKFRGYIWITLSIRLSVQIRVRPITFFFVWHWLTIFSKRMYPRDAHIHDPDTTFTNLCVFDMFSCPCHNFFGLTDIGLPYLAYGYISLRQCVAYIHDPDSMLTFDIKVKFIGFCHVFMSHLWLLLALMLAYHIWHMGLSPWEDVSSLFMTLIRSWTLTSRSNLEGLWHDFVFRPQLFLSFDIVRLCLESECITMVRCVVYIHELCMTLILT